jgi:mannan endo-1,4-beta-mannosidase
MNSKIIDPAGKEFIPVGANVNGPNSWWNGYTAGNGSIAKDRWRWNTIRLNTCYDNTACPHTGGIRSTVNNDLDAIINDYTSKKIVVQIVLFNYTGGFPEGTELTKATNWWVSIANKYKGNPYVWFNLLNEPGDQPSTIPQWNSVTDTLSTAIRNTGAKNVIVADGTSWGQEVYRGWDCLTSINPADSGILSKGSDLATKHKNMIFNVHVYDWWGGGDCSDSARDQLITWYFGQAKIRNLSVHVGELQGASELKYDYKPGTTAAARAFFRKAPELRIGLLYWHGNGGSTWTSDLVDVSNPEWYKINSTATNLTEWGILLRNYALQVNP